jgi:hypothetical protein
MSWCQAASCLPSLLHKLEPNFAHCCSTFHLLQALIAAKPSVSVENMPDAAEIIAALLAKGSNDMNAIVGLINALATKPNITMPTVALNIPQINMPEIPMPQINLPQMPSIDINTIVNAATALKGNRWALMSFSGCVLYSMCSGVCSCCAILQNTCQPSCLDCNSHPLMLFESAICDVRKNTSSCRDGIISSWHACHQQHAQTADAQLCSHVLMTPAALQTSPTGSPLRSPPRWSV